ncbi:tetratricopeptide repeat protein [Leptobacterium sp. I13]|uniref:tetratricopeptide repeat protein n=1 Tax=Leptobacterium meishanense TaxID=3128904 RepID=UPI0030EF18BC
MKKMKWILLFVGVSQFAFSQTTKEEKEKQKALVQANNLVYDANSDLAEAKFADAEAAYRKAISKSGDYAAAKYNLGNAYYSENSLGEAFSRYKQAGEVADSKGEKHSAYHNMGNVFMKNKEYEKAVEAYKESLRNDPADDETRYNLALAKEMLKKQQQENEKNKDNKDNKEDKKDKDQDNKDGENNKDKKSDNKEDEKKEDKNGENKEGDKNPEKDNKGENDKKQDKKEENKQGEKPEDQKGTPQQRPSQLSPQQIKNLLEAMNNEEKKVQDKLNAKKVKGKPVKAEKDW